MSEHDQTNRGVFFKPHPDQQMIGQGRINANGADQRIIVVREKMSREGNPVRSVYMRVGVLFDNDKKGNDKAPDYSGPLDVPAGWRMSGWLGKMQVKTTALCKSSHHSTKTAAATAAAVILAAAPSSQIKAWMMHSTTTFPFDAPSTMLHVQRFRFSRSDLPFPSAGNYPLPGLQWLPHRRRSRQQSCASS